MQNGERDWTVGETGLHYMPGSRVTLVQSWEGAGHDGAPTRLGVSMSVDVADLVELRDVLTTIIEREETQRGKSRQG